MVSSRRIVAVTLFLLPVISSVGAEEDDMSASGFDNLRIEQEAKLLVPNEIADDVLAWLKERYVENRSRIVEIDPSFTTYVHVEDFTDVYYDTPSLQLYAMQSGVRHRTRLNLTDPDHEKSGRELMQIKLNDISANDLERGEIKFRIEHIAAPRNAVDKHPMLGIVKKKDREPFQNRLAALGLDPWSMRPVLTVRDLRTRIYFNRADQPFMSISFDQASSKLLWAEYHFVEIEPELNEIGFTDADPETRRYMESILKEIVGEIQAAFPHIQSNLTPKYNKSFDALEAEIPYLRALVRADLHHWRGLVPLVAVGFFVLGFGGYLGLTHFARRVRAQRRIGSLM